MNFFQKVFSKISCKKKECGKANYKYRDLAPENNIANGEEYFEELNWALNNTKVHNIALSGPYGAGKSSILESFFAQHSEYSPIKISLASFTSKRTSTPVSETAEAEGIAKGFLQQLFYKVDYKRIPQSRYRKLHRIRISRIFVKLLAVIALALLTLCILNNSYLVKIFSQMKDWGKGYGIGPVICIVISCCVFALVIGAISILAKWTLTHIGNAEINIADKAKFSTDKSNTETIFNKYLDEIVYFFEETKYDVVIFEDIDRYDNAEIFVMLRDLNRLLNSNESIEQHVVFIYALKDDFFESSTERTKFFDFIISVIPYINSTNSDNLFRRRIEEIKKSGMQVEIDDEYITKVAPYISDMRVLTSIFNDFVLYKNTLNKDKELMLSDEQMLSLMIYKNLNPQDFAAIESESGHIKDSMKAKKGLIEKKTEEKQKKLDLLKERVESSAKDCLGSVEEFKIILLYNLSQKNGIVTSIQANGKQYKFATIMEDSFDMELLCNTQLTVSYISANGNGSSSISIKDIDEYSYDDKSIVEHWEALKLVDKEKRELALKEIEELRNEIYRLKALKIKDMIDAYGTDFLSDDELFVEKNKLLIFFLRNGYIDETYVNYINYFHPDSITVDEQKFILNVRNFDGIQNFEQDIVHKQRVIDRLVSHEFRQEEILNFSLIEYLFSTNRDVEKQNELLTLLSSRSESVKEFLQRYLQKYDVGAKKLIERVAKSNPFMWIDLYNDETIPDEIKVHYFDMIISFVGMDDLLRMDKETDRSIARYLECTSAIFSRLSLASVGRVNELLHLLDVKIKELECEGIDGTTIGLIFAESKFEINRVMINQFIAWKSPEQLEKSKHSNYSILLFINDENVLNYINDNFDEYMNNIFLQNENDQESEDAILKICSKYDFSGEAITVINSQRTIFKDIWKVLNIVEDKEVVRSLVEHIIESGKSIASWSNITAYYECYGLTEFISDIIQNNITNLCDDQENPDDVLVCELLKCTWEKSCFSEFIQKYKLSKFTLSMGDIPKENVNAMLDENYIEFSMDIYNDLFAIYPEYSMKYILNHYRHFFESAEMIGIEYIPCDEIMLSNKVQIVDKLSIIQLMPASQISESMAYVIRETSLSISKDYVLAAWNLLDNKNKYQLLLNHLEEFDNSELPSLFNELEYMYRELAKRSRHKVSLYCDDYNEALLKKLEKKRYVSSTGYEDREKTVFDPLPRKVKEKYVYGWVRAVKNA